MNKSQVSKETVKPEPSMPIHAELTQSPKPRPTGAVPIPMTNDYLFRAFLQRNNRALKGLVAALLYKEPEAIASAEIMNPIELGNSVNDKTFILDIRVSLNNHTRINLEMQVINEHNWTERSLCYLCRDFSQLTSGEKYQTVKPVIQIGILNFSLFPQYPEFYATYKMLNVKTYTLYSDKLRLSVLDLTHRELATEQDRKYQLNNWAALFKAATWEEINMLAKKNEYIDEAANTIYQLTQEEKIRMQCEAREDYYRTQLGWQWMLAEQRALLEEKDAMLEKKDAILAEKDAMLGKKDAMLAEKDATIQKLRAALEAKPEKAE